ncbi:unnamed protein product [Paramecium sonneborni]|uniref:Uncharacterized protein n=1 Tax=Paramecium sonneborni TaxID=65129 RepID=A0A8S1MQT9_9CILI|nr:unnamed protein product [Paramecium sonneborni]
MEKSYQLVLQVIKQIIQIININSLNYIQRNYDYNYNQQETVYNHVFLSLCFCQDKSFKPTLKQQNSYDPTHTMILHKAKVFDYLLLLLINNKSLFIIDFMPQVIPIHRDDLQMAVQKNAQGNFN